MHSFKATLLAPAAALAVGAALAATPSSASAASAGYIVAFKPGVSNSEQKSIVKGAKGEREVRFKRFGMGLVRPRSGVQAKRMLELLRRNPDVEYVERDAPVSLLEKVPDDPYFVQLYGLNNKGKVKTDAVDAWSTKTSGKKVALLDTGCDTDHPDLQQNIWVNDDETPQNGRDDDGNGYVDDHKGVNLIFNRGSGEDDNGHGTHVAGIVGARGNNGIGITGAAWKVKMVCVKVMNATGSGNVSDILEGIDYAIDAGARIVNMSLGTTTDSQALEDAIAEAKDDKVLFVVAAGNDGKNIDKDKNAVYPAAYSLNNILSVAASTSKDKLASFSNYGDERVDVAAPGEDILSTYLAGNYANMSGTSMAAPMVTGAAAILLKVNSDASYGDLRKALRKKVDTKDAYDGKIYKGRLNFEKALEWIDDQ